MKLLLDMNLSPDWLAPLRAHGYAAVHWSEIGDWRAPDADIMQWARENGCVVFTHDLDFGILLAHTRSDGPSVMQVRAQNVKPEHLFPLVLGALNAHGHLLEAGALLTISEAKSRVRILPI